MPQPTRAEKDAIRFTAFRMTVKSLAEFTVMQQRFRLFEAVQHRHDVLDGNPVPGLVEIDGIAGIRPFHKPVGDQQFGHDVIGAAGMPAQPLGIGQGGKKNDTVAHQTDIVEQGRALFSIQPFLGYGEAQRLVR